LTQRSADATVASDLNASKLTKVIQTFRAQAQSAAQEAGQVSSTLSGTAGSLQRQLAAMVTTYGQAESGVESPSQALNRRAQDSAASPKSLLARSPPGIRG